jgi:hydrogenase maturation protease
MSKSTPLLVLGLGNVLLGDDGVGGAAVSLLLDRYEPPRGVQVLDGGTLGLSLLPYLDAADAVILVDAIAAEAPAGSFLRLDGDQVAPAVATRLSAPDWRCRPSRRRALARSISPATGAPWRRAGGLELAVGLSPQVARALPDLVERVVDEACARLRIRRNPMDAFYRAHC